MKTKVHLALMGLVLGLAPQVALADVFWAFDANLPDGHGFYNGSGNVDGHFTTSTTDYGSGKTISLSLRGATRFVGPITPININDYVCSAGQSCNFEFSVATTGLTIGDFSYDLLINDLTTGLSLSFSPTLIPDNSYWTGSKTTGTFAANAAAVGFQNSEFLGFGFIATPTGYHSGDQVTVTLSALPSDTTLADPFTKIGFNTAAAVPEPSAIILLFTVVGFLGFMQLRRRRAQA